MSIGLRKIILACAGAFTLTGAVHASEINITIRTDAYSQPQRIVDYNGDVFVRREYRRSDPWYEDRDPDRFYGRPVPEWRGDRPHRGEYRGIPVVERHEWHRPIFSGPRWGYRDSCRIIIKERVNRWGEVVRVRREVCR